TGCRQASIKTAAAIFDIHIERNAVSKITSNKNFTNDPPAERSATFARRLSKPYRSAVTPSTKPPKNSARIGSIAQFKTFGRVNFSSSGPSRSGIRAQSKKVGTKGGTISLSHKARHIAAIIAVNLNTAESKT